MGRTVVYEDSQIAFTASGSCQTPEIRGKKPLDKSSSLIYLLTTLDRSLKVMGPLGKAFTERYALLF